MFVNFRFYLDYFILDFIVFRLLDWRWSCKRAWVQIFHGGEEWSRILKFIFNFLPWLSKSWILLWRAFILQKWGRIKLRNKFSITTILFCHHAGLVKSWLFSGTWKLEYFMSSSWNCFDCLFLDLDGLIIIWLYVVGRIFNWWRRRRIFT